ncbi:hypothetical protein ALI22I_05645 [Saccharothrix sp. ALI-22-I]|nr:hypothetical protein ALI22I_05645 [Saccharothrix sp. ALI-22-I]
MVETAQGLGLHDHLCWRYDDPAELRARVREFLSDGLARGQRVFYVGSAPADALLAELQGIDGIDEAWRRGAVRVASLTDTHSIDTPVEPTAQVRAYVAATAEALAAGFTGLRVAAEATPLVRTAAQLEAFVRYEHLVDQYIAAHPFSAMCAYNAGELGDSVIEQLACLHPNTNQDTIGFRLHGSSNGAYSASLHGELDLSTANLFIAALHRIELPLRDGELVIDATGLDFIDHGSLLRLHDHAQRRAATLVLHTSHAGPARIAQALDLADVRVEQRVEHAA